MCGAGLPPGAVAQQEYRSARIGCPQAQPAGGGEVEQPGMAADIGNHGGHGPASQGLFGGPEQFAHGGRTHQDQGVGGDAMGEQARAIGHAQPLGFARQLQVDDGGALRPDEALGLAEGKAKQRPGIAMLVGEDFLQQTARQHRKGTCLFLHALPGLRQGRFPFDIGNGIAQRGKALLAIGQGHRSGSVSEQNRNI